MKLLRRLVRRLPWALGGLLLLAAIPVVWNESVCVGSPGPVSAPFTSQLDPPDRRDPQGTYLAYPEWAIVHAYQDLAGVTRRESESAFDYAGAIKGYWSGLCGITHLTSSRFATSFGSRTVLYVIGLSFSAEMGIKGAWERTVGAITAWIRGTSRTPEDEYALTLADDYARFLQKDPWYDFPFGERLQAFWSRVPMSGGSMVRKLERRVALSLEWGGKALYAAAMRSAAAAAMPFPTRIRSVVRGLDSTDLAADPRITMVRTMPGGAAVIETDRYGVLTGVIAGLVERNRELSEIAGNNRVLVSLLLPPGAALPPDGGTPVLEVPVQAEPGWRRVGLDVAVPQLAALIRGIGTGPARLELVYDFY